VRAVINLTDEDFELIKDVRDRIAHGEPPEVPESGFTRITIIINKIALLLTYWTFHDLGLSKAEFLGAMNATHNRLYLGALVDRKSLARATGTATFLQCQCRKVRAAGLTQRPAVSTLASSKGRLAKSNSRRSTRAAGKTGKQTPTDLVVCLRGKLSSRSIVERSSTMAPYTLSPVTTTCS